MRNIIVSTIFIAFLLTGCSGSQPQYKIGMSQCLDDAWRQKMNEEMDCEMLLHPNISLTRRIAYGSNELQCAQIDSFIAERVDLLIVSPNEAEQVKPAVTRAYRAGIPVIVADRRVTGDEWTAFIGGDNYKVGQLMAEWVREQCTKHNAQFKSSKFTVLEVEGMQESVPEQLRHRGFIDGLDDAFPGEKTKPRVYSVSGCKDAYSAVAQYLEEHARVDAIVAQNDIMAIEAAKAVNDNPEYGKGTVPIMGVDGIQPGLQAIVNGDIECTAVYPTRGDLIVQTAVQILQEQPFVRDTTLETMLIDATSAYPLLRQFEARKHDLSIIQLVKLQSQNHRREMRNDRFLLLTVIVVLALLFLVALVFVIVMQRRTNAEISKTILPQLEGVQEVIQLSRRDEAFMERVREIVDAHLTDPEFSVEILGSMLQLSRTQLFRRMKKIADVAPLDYIRERRLLRADEMLRTTDKTIRQVALELCFNKPAYFSKCYKEYFGYLPSEAKK